MKLVNVEEKSNKLKSAIGTIGKCFLKPNLVSPDESRAYENTTNEALKFVGKALDDYTIIESCNYPYKSIEDTPAAKQGINNFKLIESFKKFTVFDTGIGNYCLASDLFKYPIINLSRLKYHPAIGYSAALKNSFGLFGGFQKALMHNAPEDDFFDAIIKLNLNLNQICINEISDNKLRYLVVSKDPFLIDALNEKLLGLSNTPMIRAIKRAGIKLDHTKIRKVIYDIKAIKLHKPARRNLTFKLKNAIGSHLFYPKIIGKCNDCSECIEICPFGAIKDRTIDKSKCTMCYACLFHCKDIVADPLVITKAISYLRRIMRS